MTWGRRVLASTAIVVGGGLVLWALRPVPSFGPSVQLPDGVSLAEILRSGKNETAQGWQTNKYCLGGRPAPDLSILAPGERASLLFESIRYKVHEMLGRTLARVPASPRVDYVTPRLGECFGVSGEKYLYAKEFGLEVSPYKTEDEWKYLGFVWGGANQLRHARDWIALIEEGIRQNGIFTIRLNDGRLPLEILGPTNRCAIIRDTKGFVKILPLDCVKAYVDAGLVRLPMESGKTSVQPHGQVPAGPNESMETSSRYMHALAAWWRFVSFRDVPGFVSTAVAHFCVKRFSLALCNGQFTTSLQISDTLRRQPPDT